MMVTALSTILNANWDTDLIAKPSFITYSEDNMRAYKMVVASLEIDFDDATIGIGPNRVFFSAESYNSYDVFIRADSKANARLMIQAIKKVCSTFSPSATENIMEWDGPDMTRDFNDVMVEYKMTIYIRKAGKASY